MRLSTAVHDFVMHMRSEHKSRATIVGYESDCNLLVSLATVHGGDSVLSFTPEVVRQYFLLLSKRNLKMATLHRRRASISEFAKYCLRRRFLTSDPMVHAPRIRRPKHLPRPFTHEEHQRLMALELMGSELVLRAVLYFAGLRITEAVSLRIQDAVLGDDDRLGYIRVRGKGDKERAVPMFPELRAVLYDEFVRRAYEPINAFLFRQGNEKPWTRKMAEQRTRRWGDRAHVEDCTPHRWRHTCGTHLHERGWDIRDIQEFLGHEAIQTTVLYTKVTAQKLVDAVRLKPLGVIGPGSAIPPGGAA